MKPRLLVFTSAVAAFSPVGAARRSLPAGAEDTIRRVLRWSAGGEHTLEVSNVNGSIYVIGDDWQDVEMTADRTIDTNGRDAFRETQRNIRLEATESADTVRTCADAESCDCSSTERWSRNWWRDWDSVHVDFTVRVPKNKAPSLFKTVNGRIEIVFPKDLAADLRMKTLNGGLYTDFDVTMLPSAPVVAKRRNGTFVYRNDRFADVRIGRGGPLMTFDGVNGDVHVLRGDN